MNSFAPFFEAAPFMIATIIGAAIPSGRSAVERLCVGLVAGLSIVFLNGMYPAAAGSSSGDEWPHLLTAILFIPLLGAVAEIGRAHV